MYLIYDFKIKSTLSLILIFLFVGLFNQLSAKINAGMEKQMIKSNKDIYDICIFFVFLSRNKS